MTQTIDHIAPAPGPFMAQSTAHLAAARTARPFWLLRSPIWRLAVAMLFVVASTAADAAPEIWGVEKARAAALADEVTLIDIRTPEEWHESGVGDVAHPIDMLDREFVNRVTALREAHPQRRIALICATGSRSRAVAQWFARQGVPDIIDVGAGMHGRNGWLAMKLPVRTPDSAPLTSNSP